MTTTKAATLADEMAFKTMEAIGVHDSNAARKDALFKAVKFLADNAAKWSGYKSPDNEEYDRDVEDSREMLRDLVREAFKPRS